MLVYFLAFALLVVGLGAVAWLFLQEEQREKESKAPSLLDRLGIDTPPAKETSAEKKDSSASAEKIPEKPPETISIDQKEISSQVEASLEEIEKLTEEAEFKAKCERLEMILKEKNEEIEKKENALSSELKAKKEFNRIKDGLEKEIKDLKDKNHKTQLELSAAQAEVETYRKRGLQLEEKI